MPSPLYLCLHVRDFAAVSASGRSGVSRVPDREAHAYTSSLDQTAGAPGSRRAVCGDNLGKQPTPLAILSGDPPLERVFSLNDSARQLGLQLGMSRVQAESFPATVVRRDRHQEDLAFASLITCAQQLSPRIQILDSPADQTCGATLILDVSGSERLLGPPHQIAAALHRSVLHARYNSSVVAAHNAYAALLAARGLPGVTSIPTGHEAQTLAPLPLSVLELSNEQAATFATWGIETLGQLAALPTKSLIARIGPSAFHLQAQARGEYSHLLVPAEEPADAALSEHMELDHPVELLEPLLFLLGHMLEQITTRAAERALAIASVETTLILSESDVDFVGHPERSEGPQHSSNILSRSQLSNQQSILDSEYKTELRRTIRPALPERNHLTLLKLIQLDLELHPPEAPIVALRIQAQPARPQIAQHGLFAAQAPEAGRLEILLARLRKLVGEDRVGAPELLDTHSPETFRVTNFEIAECVSHTPASSEAPAAHASALRMIRPPREVSVELAADTPAAMYYEGQRVLIHTSSGPWRTNGAWWTHPAWCREEWDVILQAEPQRCLRLAHDPSASCWYVIGTYD